MNWRLTGNEYGNTKKKGNEPQTSGNELDTMRKPQKSGKRTGASCGEIEETPQEREQRMGKY